MSNLHFWVELKVKGNIFFFRSSLVFFQVSIFERKIMRFFDVWPAKLLKLHSICSRSRFEGTLDSGENPFFLSFSGFNELTSNFHKIYPAGLSNLRSDVGKFTFRKDNFFITRFLFFFFQIFGIQAEKSRFLGEKTRRVCWICLPMSPFIVQGSISGENFRDFYMCQGFCIFNNNFRTPIEICSAGLSKLQSRV